MGKSQEREHDLAFSSLEELQKETVPRKSWPIPMRSWIPCPNDWTQSRWRSLWTMGCFRGWRSHSPFDNTRSHCKNKLSLHWNKQSSKTMPYIVLISHKHCLPCNDHNKKQQKNHTCFLSQIQTMAVGTEFLFYMVELARLLVISYNSEKQEGGELNFGWTGWPITHSILARNLRKLTVTL